MVQTVKAIKGNVIYAESWTEIKVFLRSYIVYSGAKVQGIYTQLPKEFKNIAVTDYGEALIIPGFIDLHTHAAQFMQRGIGLDKELINWLTGHTFPTEKEFNNKSHAESIYRLFVEELLRKGTTRASILATVHKESTDLLGEIATEKGLGALIGKINMDQNCPSYMKEDTQKSICDTEELLCKYKDNSLVQTIITPRFVPTCSEQLLSGLGKLADRYRAPVQSHLSENRDEVIWVKDLYPQHKTYADVYDAYGLLGQTPTLMAHCIFLEESEVTLLANRNVVAVHCPQANMNLASGLMPARSWRERGVQIGLGSDVGAGHELSMNKIMVQAIQNSKLLKAIEIDVEKQTKPLTFQETFYMATKGNGMFFNSLASYQDQDLRVGSLEAGYAFDALVVDNCDEGNTTLSIEERLQQFLYIGDDRHIIQRYINGKMIEI